MVKLGLDEALINFINQSNETLFIWRQYKECYKCPFQYWSNITSNNTKPLKTTTNYELEYLLTNENNAFILDDNNKTYCRNSRSLWDQSIHNITISESAGSNDSYTCSFQTQDEGRDNIWPIVGAVIIYVLFAVLFYVGRRLYYKWRDGRAMDISLPTVPEAEQKAADDKKRKRLKSLDCFRGITILMMIFVNLGAGGYEVLEHAAWDGFNFADIIFPWFVFIMGTTMAISFKSIVIRQKTPVWKIYYRITIRSLKLFVIGIILNSNGESNFHTLRIPGVLQRFAISYFVVASAHVLSLLLHKGELFGALRIHRLVDIIPYWPEWIVMSIMAIIYFCLSFAWQYDPDCPKGYVGPGGLYDNASHVNCTGGAANYIDRKFFGEAHIYQHFTGDHLYDPSGRFGLKHEPEGILGSTTSIILTFFGLQIGKILIAYPNHKQRIIRWIIWGLVLGGLSAVFAATGWIPINKNLWSFSFICLTSSAACFAISLLYYLIDVIRFWPNGQPFHYPGMNSILLYIGHEVCSSMLPWDFNVDETSHVGLLAKNLCATTVWFIVSVVLAQKGFFLTL